MDGIMSHDPSVHVHACRLLPGMAVAGLRPQFGRAGSDVWSFVLSAPDSGGYISAGFSPAGEQRRGRLGDGRRRGRREAVLPRRDELQRVPTGRQGQAGARRRRRADHRVQGVPALPVIPARRPGAHGRRRRRPGRSVPAGDGAAGEAGEGDEGEEVLELVLYHHNVGRAAAANVFSSASPSRTRAPRRDYSTASSSPSGS
ncbi:hypothetical protein ACP4OV_029857 [Aristida adscensionis]